MKYFTAAFKPTTRADGSQSGSGGEGSGRSEGSGFAVLRQQSEHELALSEVHSKLDQALNFLQRDVGYCLLSDARPDIGGGVRLRQKPAFPQARDHVAKGVQSARVPQGAPLTGAIPSTSVSGSSAQDKAVEEEEQRAREAEVEPLLLVPETARYAHHKEDLLLVSRFARIISEHSSEAERKVKHEALFKTVLQGVRLMHLCDYPYADVVLVLAYASVYFRSTFEKIGHKMSEHEAAHVCVLLIYLAHSFLLDETCPLRCWQKHIFRKYCTLKVLDAALFRLFQMRKDYGLRITERELQGALQGLSGHVNGGLKNGGTSSADPVVLVRAGDMMPHGSESLEEHDLTFEWPPPKGTPWWKA